MNTNLPTPTPSPARNNGIVGIALVAIGALALISQLTDLQNIGMLVLPILALIFLAWGMITRTFGLIIPGGILAGIGGAALLIENMTLTESTQGGVFLLTFAAGWALITLLSPLTREGLQLWPLIPGSIMAVIGGLLLAGDAGEQILNLIGLTWPAILIGVGLYILFKKR
ncbi:MAG: hypothetical protein HUU23_14060 [Caldilineales bacterium]|nr:hypothetical protein [Caldilineales bacterium]